MKKPTVQEGLTVAIVTARSDEDTTYEVWRSLRNAFLAGAPTWTHPENETVLDLGKADRRHRYLGGEFGALLAACFHDGADHHIEYQIRALAMGTELPEAIFVVSRDPPPSGWGTDSIPWEQPMLSAKELELIPEAGCHHLTDYRSKQHCLGCSDKNTALALCPTRNLLVLDDCCLPGFGVVETAKRVCAENKVLFLQHRQLYLPSPPRPDIEIADANHNFEDAHLVMGIWAAPVEHFLAINGWNTALDGERGGLDAELMVRLGRYAKMRDIEYATSPAARVYEIQHTYPWGKGQTRDWRPLCPPGYRAPGPDLFEIREAVQASMEGFYVGEESEEIEEDEGDDGPAM